MALDLAIRLNTVQVLFVLQGLISVILHVLETVQVNQDSSLVGILFPAVFLQFSLLILLEEPLNLPNIFETECFLHHLLPLDRVVVRLCYRFDQGVSKLGVIGEANNDQFDFDLIKVICHCHTVIKGVKHFH